jgi:hypothetical protein
MPYLGKKTGAANRNHQPLAESGLETEHMSNVIEMAKQAKGLATQNVQNTTKIARRKPVSSAIGLNRHTRDAVIRLAFDSCLDIKRFAYIAKYAGTKESIALDVVRQYVRDLRSGGGLIPPGSPMGTRRAA